jgi:hypothetical protein
MTWLLIETGVALLLLIFIVGGPCPTASAARTQTTLARMRWGIAWSNQWSTRGMLSVNSGIGASKAVPSSATI